MSEDIKKFASSSTSEERGEHAFYIIMGLAKASLDWVSFGTLGSVANIGTEALRPAVQQLTRLAGEAGENAAMLTYIMQYGDSRDKLAVFFGEENSSGDTAGEVGMP
jgi:hypothetical protein